MGKGGAGDGRPTLSLGQWRGSAEKPCEETRTQGRLQWNRTGQAPDSDGVALRGVRSDRQRVRVGERLVCRRFLPGLSHPRPTGTIAWLLPCVAGRGMERKSAEFSGQLSRV